MEPPGDQFLHHEMEEDNNDNNNNVFINNGYFNNQVIMNYQRFNEEEEDGFIYHDDDDDDNGGFYGENSGDATNFDQIENSEATKTMHLLLNNDFRIFEEQHNYLTELQNKQNSSAFERPRYFTEGYEANVDTADDLELARWQYFFPHIQIVGEGKEGTENSDADYRRHPSYDSEHFKAEQEIIVQNQTSISGSRSDQATVNRIVQEAWPAVVDILRPLIQETLNYAQENNIPSSIEEYQAMLHHKNAPEAPQTEQDEFWD